MLPPSELNSFRTSLVPPIPQLAIAADLLSQAGNAVVDGDEHTAREKLDAANMPALREYARAIMGRHERSLFVRRDVGVVRSAVTRVKERHPRAEVRQLVYARDGWRCRYCQCRVVAPEARQRLKNLFPREVPWNGGQDDDDHGAFLALTATLDHVVPHSVGGTNEPDNLVTTCWPCNFGKDADTLQELGLLDPRSRSPIVDGWDGLKRVLKVPSPKQPPQLGQAATDLSVPDREKQPSNGGSKLSVRRSESTWAAKMEGIEPGMSVQLVEFAESCITAETSYAINKILVFRVPSRHGLLNPLAVDPDYGVFIPWAVSPYKEAARHLCNELAAVLPDAVLYETPKTWAVRKQLAGGKRRNFTAGELLDAASEVRAALVRFGQEIAEEAG